MAKAHHRFGPRGYSWDYVGEESGRAAQHPHRRGEDQANSTSVPWAYGIYWCFADFWSQKNMRRLHAGWQYLQQGSYIDNGSVGLPVMTY